MNDTLVSVIVPVYNSGLFLKKCLDSILSQTYKKLEIICIDSESTDNSSEILKQYAASDTRIHIISEKNDGVSIARNYGLNAMTGKYVLFVDSDDWIDHNTIETALKTMFEYDSDMVFWSYLREFNDSSKAKQIYDKEQIIFDSEECKKFLHRRMVGIVDEELRHPENADALCTIWGKLYRADIIRENKICFEDIRKIGTYEDGLFNLYYLKYVEKAVYINKYFYHYRKTNESSITTRYKPQLPEQWQYLFKLMKNYLDKNHLEPKYYEALSNRIALSILGLGLNLMSSNMKHFQKVHVIKSIISRKTYRKCIRRLAIKYLPLHWKIFYGCAKYNNSVAVYLLLLCISKLIK